MLRLIWNRPDQTKCEIQLINCYARKNMNTQQVAEKFRSVIACERCDCSTSKKIQRDKLENVPQPGFIGKHYRKHRVLLVGQNPGIAPDRFQDRDSIYTKALRDFEREGNLIAYQSLYDELMKFVPDWPVQRNYFPLAECGLDLHDIAYCNRVRCRTVNNEAPSKKLVNNCETHFLDLIEELKPRVIVFIGKWAYTQSIELLLRMDIRVTYMNRNRSLNAEERLANRNAVVDLVKNTAQPSEPTCAMLAE